jgi:hypothetical protein
MDFKGIIPQSLVKYLNTAPQPMPKGTYAPGAHYARPDPNRLPVGDLVRELDPTYTVPRGVSTLRDVDYGAIKDFLTGKYQISDDPRASMQRAGSAVLGMGEGVLDAAPALVLAKPAVKAAKAAAPHLAEAGVRQLNRLEEKYGLPTSPTMNIIPPQGNLNFTTRLDEQIRGPETQTVFDLLKQVQGKPGVTKEGLKKIAQNYPDSAAKISKQEFKENIPASYYRKEDLATNTQDMFDNYLEEAMDNMDTTDTFSNLGLPNRYHQVFDDVISGHTNFSELDRHDQGILARNFGLDHNTMTDDDIFNVLGDRYMDQRHTDAYEYAMDRAGGSPTDSGYSYKDFQRLVPESGNENYFEFGVTHPEQMMKESTGQAKRYKHYSNESMPGGLVGHVRGSHVGEPTVIQGGIEVPANSYVIEEIQSDAQKGIEQTGALHQVHGTLFKAAIQDAAEKGADYVYLPTSYPIGLTRHVAPENYASIYDKAVMKEGIDPLRSIPGIEINTIQGRHLMPNYDIADQPYYHEIKLTPEAREHILSGPGQSIPGYAAGGLVATGYAEGGLKATPRNKTLGSLVDAYNAYVDPLLNKYEVLPQIPLFGGMTAGDLGPNQARNIANEMSYGNYKPFRNTRNIQTMTLDPDTFDVASMVPIGGIAAKLGKPLAKAAGRSAAKAAVNKMVGLEEKYGLPTSPVMNIVKPEGPSNWLPGSIERQTNRLKLLPAQTEELLGSDITERGLIDIWREMHSPTVTEQAITPAGQARFLEKNYPDKLADFGFAYTPEQTAVNTWIDKRLNKYIRNDMATESDPIRALAERGILHSTFDPIDLTSIKRQVEDRRTRAGLPAEGVAESRLARDWELASDYAIEGNPASLWRNEADREVLATIPWQQHLSPEDIIFERTDPGMRTRLNFDHLVDELSNSVSPTAELPQHLRLTTKQLEQLPMEKAVEHVAKINEWRSAEAAKAEAAGLSDNLLAEANYVDKSFTPSFAKGEGGKWVDIPETTTKEGHALCTSLGKAGGWCTQGDSTAERYGSGNNRLSVLLDADGRPHAQVTIASPDKEAMPKNITELKPVGNSLSGSRASEYTKRDPEYQGKIRQSVINFLNNGKWGEVPRADLNHLEITRLPNGKFYSYDEVRQGIAKAAKDPNATLSTFQVERWSRRPDEFTSHVEGFKDRVWPQYEKFFAAGGLVASDYDDEHIDRMSDEIMNFKKGGQVTGQPHENEYVKAAGKFSRKTQGMAASLVPGLRPILDKAQDLPLKYYAATGEHNGEADAMRHMLLQAQLMQKYGETPAKAIGWLHENISFGQPEREQAMDEYNDILGREIGAKAKSEKQMIDMARQYIDSKKAKSLAQDNAPDGYAQGGLVYNDEEINNLADQLLGA